MRQRVISAVWALGFLVGGSAIIGCSGGDASRLTDVTASTCMRCHNGSSGNDYAGPGMENPHPFPAAANIECSVCHGGDPTEKTKVLAHIPPPPEIGNREFQDNNRFAYFNRLTLTGIDKLPNYEANGRDYTALDYLQWINPGDLRIVSQQEGCGTCHSNHGDVVNGSILATSAGILGSASYAYGADNRVASSDGLYQDTASDTAFRAVQDADNAITKVGDVLELIQYPVYSLFGVNAPDSLFNNNNYLAADMADDVQANGQVITNSPLEHVLAEQMSFTCGDCHLGSRGANNRTGDYRSSGCTACHMPYSLGGRSFSDDPFVNKLEPLDPDNINDPEQAHPRRHRIVNIAKTFPTGVTVEGMSDYTCAGCHQGSNRTVMQFWGIRLDQNQDVRRGNQYPAQPASYKDTDGDTRLFDPVLGNNEFNGRNHHQYLLEEDYDGDTLDDTPEDVHYAAGMGCIDCHGSYDLHGGDVTNPSAASISSRMEQSVAIRCISCHGPADSYAATVTANDASGSPREFGLDSAGNRLKHVYVGDDGNYYMRSKLTGNVHFISQTLDTIVDTGATHPVTNQPIYNARASYAMGRADGNAGTGIGPQQTGGMATANFSHTDRMDCVSCHSSWTNTCMGCHLEGEYNTNNNLFSNITGQRTVFNQKEAQFIYQSPVPFQLGVGPSGKITQVSSNTKLFFVYEDRNNDDTGVFAFSDRQGNGNNPASAFQALGHNAMMAHSIRDRVDTNNEGPRYCVACHLTDDGMAAYGTEYNSFKTAMENSDWGALDFPLLQQHIGQNTGNQLDSPLWVHMVAGLGSGLFLFDENGCAVNPLDANEDRYGCNGNAPADNFNPANVVFNLDRLVETNGQPNSSSGHPLMNGPTTLRTGAFNPNMAGPLGSDLVRRLTDPATGIVLDSWLDADAIPYGQAGAFMGLP